MPADDIKALEEQLGENVGLQRRLGDDDFSLADSLVAHRRQCIENLRDSADPFWEERIKMLDRLATSKGIPMYDEPGLSFVIDELRERERQRRAERIHEARAAT